MLILRCTINILLQFIILYFNNFILPRPENLYVILARRKELPEDDILNVETCRSMLFVIIVFVVIVQSLVNLQISDVYIFFPTYDVTKQKTLISPTKVRDTTF